MLRFSFYILLKNLYNKDKKNPAPALSVFIAERKRQSSPLLPQDK